MLKTKYPQGSEKHLIKAVLDREVPLGGLPADIGVAMTNVATVTSVARGVMRGIPLTHRVVSVTGGGIVHPKNLLVPIGIPMGELIDYCGGLRKTAARIVAGGPMMGFAFTNLDTPVTKGTSGITVLTHEEIRQVEKTRLCPLRPLRGCVPHEPGAHQTGHGLALQGSQPGPAIQHHGLF